MWMCHKGCLWEKGALELPTPQLVPYCLFPDYGALSTTITTGTEGSGVDPARWALWWAWVSPRVLTQCLSWPTSDATAAYTYTFHSNSSQNYGHQMLLCIPTWMSHILGPTHNLSLLPAISEAMPMKLWAVRDGLLFSTLRSHCSMPIFRAFCSTVHVLQKEVLYNVILASLFHNEKTTSLFVALGCFESNCYKPHEAMIEPMLLSSP